MNFSNSRSTFVNEMMEGNSTILLCSFIINLTISHFLSFRNANFLKFRSSLCYASECYQ